MILKTLNLITNNLNDKGITWGIGGSLMLHCYDLIENYNDIDIIVSEQNIDIAISILDKLGSRTTIEPSKIFASKYFYKYKINNICIDVIAGFTINHSNGSFKMTFDKNSIHSFNFRNIILPICTLEDWYIIYQLIPNKQEKVAILKNYFMNNGISKPEIFNSTNIKTLPISIKKDITSLIL